MACNETVQCLNFLWYLKIYQRFVVILIETIWCKVSLCIHKNSSEVEHGLVVGQ